MVILPFPPYTTHKLQPLDGFIYGTFKKFVNGESDAWLTNYIGKLWKFKITHPHSGLLVTETWPLNTGVFTDDDFSPAAVTDRTVQDNRSLEYFRLLYSHTSNSNSDISSKLPTSGLNKGQSSSVRNLHHVSPAEIRSFPEAEARREARVTALLTDTAMRLHWRLK
jgi:hypothetical protein